MLAESAFYSLSPLTLTQIWEPRIHEKLKDFMNLIILVVVVVVVYMNDNN